MQCINHRKKVKPVNIESGCQLQNPELGTCLKKRSGVIFKRIYFSEFDDGRSFHHHSHLPATVYP